MTSCRGGKPGLQGGGLGLISAGRMLSWYPDEGSMHEVPRGAQIYSLVMEAS
jgi:hypothetical protein